VKHFLIGRGQLGGAVLAHLPTTSTTVARVDWSNLATAEQQLTEQLEMFIRQGGPATVSWCAGAGVVGTSEAELAKERRLLDAVLLACARADEPLKLFLASSAGGLYADSSDVCTESTEVAPRSDYGRSKLIQERTVAAWAADSGAEVLIGRISNLYGPRQNLTKGQGFISHLLLSMRNQQPFIYFVTASSIRDFVYTDDVASQIAGWLQHSAFTPMTVTTKIFAAERSVSLAQVATLASRVTRRQARVLFAPQQSTDQPASIRFHSTIALPMAAARPATSLEHGLWSTWQAMLRSR
jgi:UDP-glucose 4-epimerase